MMLINRSKIDLNKESFLDCIQQLKEKHNYKDDGTLRPNRDLYNRTKMSTITYQFIKNINLENFRFPLNLNS